MEHAKRIARHAASAAVAAVLFAGSALATRTIHRSWGARKAAADRPPVASVERYFVPLQDSPRRGGSPAKVTIVVFADLFCPACGRAASTVDLLLRSYPRDLALVFKHSPLPSSREVSTAAAVLTEVAHQRGQFWDFHDAFMRGSREGRPPRTVLRELVATAGLTEAQLAERQRDPRYAGRISRDLALAESLAARGTPYFFVNGRAVRGDKPIEAFVAVVDEEQRTAASRIAGGTPPERLYEELIKNGRPRVVGTPRRILRSE
jgi:protein-disulfide isomerase